jgi:ParB family chromosome partitioning protein
MTKTPARSTADAPERTLKTFRLGDLAVAPENLRFAEPPDEEIPQLAATIRAAGVLQPLTVRPGRRKERPAMVLDGRRRLLALQLLYAGGEIADDYAVSAFEETDPARQAAAALLTNTAVPVHVADVIAAIGKMLKSRLTPATIAAALGYAEVEVRRLAALSALHPTALEALKGGRITLRQARLLARLADRTAQAEIAGAALQGFGFQEWRVTERLDAGSVTASDRRFALVGPERYAAAGGRTEADLFGERPDVLLDPDLLQALWTERAQSLVAGLGSEQLRVTLGAEADFDDPALEPFGYADGLALDGPAREAWQASRAAAQAAAAALADAELWRTDQDAAIGAFLAVKIAADQAGAPGRALSHAHVFADRRTGLDVRCYGPPVAETEEAGSGGDPTDGDAEPAATVPAAAPQPLALAASPQVSGVGHALHTLRTDVATRVLIRALAEDPAAALAALAARLFCTMVLHRGVTRGESAFSLRAEAYGQPSRAPIESLDGEVRRRLVERRAAWEASGVSVLAWTAGLPQPELFGLLAELTALSLDLREERTTALRRSARDEAAEIAALCAAEVTCWWTPDEAFLQGHTKPQLLAMLAEMGADAALADNGKEALVQRVTAEALKRRWAPAELSWTQPSPARSAAEDGEDPAAAGVAAGAEPAVAPAP